jgi:hypothetical protein
MERKPEGETPMHAETGNESEVLSQLKRMSEQLTFLERKIDQLLSGRPPQNRGNFGPSQGQGQGRPYPPRNQYGNRPQGGYNRHGTRVERYQGNRPIRPQGQGGHGHPSNPPHHAKHSHGQRP